MQALPKEPVLLVGRSHSLPAQPIAGSGCCQSRALMNGRGPVPLGV
jgi:hypothetical protein